MKETLLSTLKFLQPKPQLIAQTKTYFLQSNTSSDRTAEQQIPYLQGTPYDPADDHDVPPMRIDEYPSLRCCQKGLAVSELAGGQVPRGHYGQRVTRRFGYQHDAVPVLQRQP